jgi:hypothetical protein
MQKKILTRNSWNFSRLNSIVSGLLKTSLIRLPKRAVQGGKSGGPEDRRAALSLPKLIQHGFTTRTVFLAFSKTPKKLKKLHRTGGRVAHISNQPQIRVPHLRDGLILAKVGHFCSSENPDTLNSPMPSGSTKYPRTLPWPPATAPKTQTHSHPDP